MKAVIRALIGLLALSVCLVVAAPSAAARTLPVGPAGAVTAVAGATAQSELPAWPVIRQGCSRPLLVNATPMVIALLVSTVRVLGSGAIGKGAGSATGKSGTGRPPPASGSRHRWGTAAMSTVHDRS